MTTVACPNYAAIMLCRFFLGMLESAIAPVFTVIVTFWWTCDEQALRNGMWYGCVGIATTVSPLINYALGHIHGNVGFWKAMFLFLGAVTFGWSFVLFVFLPDSPLTITYLSGGEKRIALARLERNKTGTISNKFNKKQFFEALRDYKTYSCALIVLLTGIPSGALGNFTPIVIHDFGFDSFDSLALTYPFGAITAISIFFVGYITHKLRNSRYLLRNICALISIAGLLFAGIYLLALQVATGSLAVSIVSSNVAGRTKKRTVSAAVFVGYSIGTVIRPLIFGASSRPLYYAGFLGSLISLVAVVVVVMIIFTLLYRENKRRDNLYVHQEGSQFVEEDLTDKENKDFRYLL
ncbi:hypothetical protein BZG36_05136 [Bifiguratus adelaidae]|uniref:Major facilitator superfamily (MFS) profile domain-containing protein n=1 Tax=Bifiguratus adelaidae TaxID=1938954 RepID=A0A261XVS9_9FUNG|nr:hypothetical protein BZG36_05136 [Bifiguratus adelaidae]